MVPGTVQIKIILSFKQQKNSICLGFRMNDLFEGHVEDGGLEIEEIQSRLRSCWKTLDLTRQICLCFCVRVRVTW